jgi:cell division protein ZapA (FtsZ GTPase activity inhibitor)
MIKRKYMDQDLEKAACEQKCSMDLLITVATALYHDDLVSAKQALKDIEKSVERLSRLQQRKLNHEKLVEAAQKLSEGGILVSVVQRRFH